MHEQSKIPTVRNLDGVYYRVVRDGNHVSRCFSDLSESEQGMEIKETIQVSAGIEIVTVALAYCFLEFICVY